MCSSRHSFPDPIVPLAVFSLHSPPDLVPTGIIISSSCSKEDDKVKQAEDEELSDAPQ